MNSKTSHNSGFAGSVRQKLADYALLVKLRLSLLVVFTASLSFLLANPAASWEALCLLALGGFLVTGAASALNQVLEKDTDKLMTRTANRPLAAGRMESSEAVLASGFMTVVGLVILSLFNPLTAVLGALSLVSYAFIYTPLKRVSPVAVWVGAIPGALPMAIGWVAATGQIGAEAFFLFSVQFIWQFPHFWAIAWLAYEDYAKAGFYLLPSQERDGRTKSTALQALFYSLLLLPLAILPYTLQLAGFWAVGVMLFMGLVYSFFALRLYIRCDRQSALQLMFSSFFYLPVVQITLLLDKTM